jgi:membrane carboxypeptidase/penicillin-binding protein
VQGTVVVLENKTGRILAMAGGFSYPLSQLNRATQSVRQPGSAIKPLSYLAALGRGLQPNTLIADEPITLPPIGTGRVREQDYWTPKNYDGGAGGVLTLRRALENSRNLATVHLLTGGIDDSPEASLDRLCRLAMEAQIYHECVRYYPFVLGAQPVRPVDLAAFYAAIANEGMRPAPYVIDSIERSGLIVYRHDPKSSAMIGSVDRAAFYQLKTMMQGVVARGTAHSIANLAPYVAGKTGTSDNENDAWFVGFTNDVTVAVWLGYDNSDGKRRTLGGGSTGGGVAVPIFEPPITECFRIDRSGQIIDTQYRLVSREEAYISRDPGGFYSVAPNPNPFGYNGYYDQRQGNYQGNNQGYYDNYGRYIPVPRDPSRPPAQVYQQRDPRAQAAPQRDPYGRPYQPPPRFDPFGFFFGRRTY